ncbi:hypothetical protein [Legionella bononiensis]|uniref:LepB protein n=1 Tax=Legionella bononiensis TaxID=2793102 RepID=A0ABS1WA64_9GAMM|nr:hypothetical protein [Legionella bononiensis]MBL7480518.1 hypothetical protein [Legionella bononiensis]MBL7526243.1 hypothetical protein [Legionella bononiensis]MBL7563262.1 hypothetical protein [Legionella bononiensis]
MPQEAAKRRLERELNKLKLNIPSSVFQYDLNRAQAIEYLKNNKSVPFIFRKSSIPGYFAFDIPSEDRQSFTHILVLPPDLDGEEFKLYNYENKNFTETGSLSRYFERAWDELHNRMRSADEIRWNQFKLSNELAHNGTIVVLSTQSLDKKKIALTAKEVQSHAQQNPGLQKSGDGHTGFAMAAVSNAPFAVLRSQENREEANNKLKDHIGDNGLIVVTGHGSQVGNAVSGTYINIDFQQETRPDDEKIERSPHDIVSSAMESGLKSGNSVTILLCICYGALDSHRNGTSFAHKLVREFAKQGISTTILATDQPFIRFGANVIIDNKITFNERVGMAAKDVHFITAKVHGPDSNPVITVFKPNESIQLSSKGIEFKNPNQLLLDQHLQQKKVEEQRLQKLAEEQLRIQKQIEEEQRLQKLADQQQLQNHSEDLLVTGHEESKVKKPIENKGDQQRNRTTTREKSPQERSFNKQLKLLLNKGSDFKLRRDRVDQIQHKGTFHALNEAYNAVLKLHQALKTDGDVYFANPTTETYSIFKANCDRHIKEAHKILDVHRGWSEFLINLAIGIITAGLGLIVKGGINLAFNRSFFYVHQTDSSKQLDEIEGWIKQATP